MPQMHATAMQSYPGTGVASAGDKEATQARQDHQQRLAANPYRPMPHLAPQQRRPHGEGHANQQRPPLQQHAPATANERRVSFSLPDGHREVPPKPARTEHVLRKLSDSSSTQLQLNGTFNNPLHVVDNRPEYIRSQGGQPTNQMRTTSSQTDQAGDVLFIQPPHLTSTNQASTALTSGQPTQPNITDLEDQADIAVQQGRAPRWEIEDDTNSMRSSIRIGEVSFDISWLQGAGPPTLPPTIPIAPNVVFSARGTVAGSWRGVLWTPQQQEVIRHPPRVRREPSMVAYKTQSTASRMGPTLSPGVTLTMYPVGDWIAVTRFELSYARTPRFWLVVVDTAPDVTQAGELPLQSDDQFFLEWQGTKREWVRRPRFQGDIDRLGGFSIIPPLLPPEPPVPPERTGFPTTQKRGTTPASSSSSSASPWSTQRGTTPTPAASSQMTAQINMTTYSTGAQPKPKPPLPPQTTSGSESETSWPSEDPEPERTREDDAGILSTATTTSTTPRNLTNNDDTSFMQRMPPPRQPTSTSPTSTNQGGATQPQRGTESWIPGSAPQTSTELLQALTHVIHELLQASFSQPNEQVTILAYRACSYLTQMQHLDVPPNTGPAMGSTPQPPPTASTFTLDNPLIEADATLGQLLLGYRDIPRRHLYKEMARVEQLLSNTKQMLATWGKDPEVPGAHEGIAGIKNALDAMDWCHLAVEEGNLAQIEETLQIAVQAIQRSRNYMDMLIAWIQRRFEDDAGSPPKRQRTAERATGSGEEPVYVQQPQPPMPPRQRDDPALQRQGPDLPPLPDQGVEGGAHGQSRPPLQRRQRLQPRMETGEDAEASPYAILRAQQLLKQALPFLEQELAEIVSQAYANLYMWTTALWGHPIQLVDSAENEEIQQAETLLETEGEVSHGSQAETVMVPPYNRGRDPTPATTKPRERQPSHRRRRLHAALANSSNSESE